MTTTATTTVTSELAEEAASRSIFRRVLVGVDDSPESLEAARQAVTLAAGPITLVAVYNPTQAFAGTGMAPVALHYDEGPFRERAEQALEQAKRELDSVDVIERISKGRAWEQLLYEIGRWDHTLVAVGSHGAGRAKGILVGSTATELIHKAPCSVLIARKPLAEFPSTIVAGVDDTYSGQRADAVAHELAERFDAKLERCVNVRHPVEVLVDATVDADLLVVGSRRLEGVRALASVSERVAHEAKCSVLIAR